MTTQVLNKSTNKLEKAKKELCPKCKGFGRVYNEENLCALCKGLGELWISSSGWTRALYRRLENSILY